MKKLLIALCLAWLALGSYAQAPREYEDTHESDLLLAARGENAEINVFDAVLELLTRTESVLGTTSRPDLFECALMLDKFIAAETSGQRVLWGLMYTVYCQPSSE